MFSCYIRLDDKTAKDAKTPRFEVTHIAGYFKPLEALKNKKNEVVFYMLKTDGIINSSDKRRAGYYLQCKDSVNFSSMYYCGKIGDCNVFYGEPPQAEFLKPKKDKKGKVTQRLNPFFNSRNDGYLILTDANFKVIEILVISDGRYLIKGDAEKLLAGQFNEALEYLRSTAKPLMIM